MRKTELENWYEPLKPQFNSIQDAMPSRRFAAIEAVLHLLLTNAPEADPRKAYLLFAQYQLIGIAQCNSMDHLLQCARNTLGYYRSRKYWQDDFSEYCNSKYAAIRAFSVIVDGDRVLLSKAEPYYPYSYEKRSEEWAWFWQNTSERKRELPMAENGRFSYSFLGSENGEFEKVYVTLSKMNAKVQNSTVLPTEECKEPIRITIDELAECARQMHEINPNDYCYKILQQNVIKEVNNGNVSISRELNIKQVVNIVGMVGSGKSTLIKVLSFWAHLRQKQIVVVVDTVTEALNLWQYLHGFGVQCSPLIGRGERLKYINQIVKSGETCLPPQLSQYLSNSCIIDGMDDAREESMVFGKEPCYSLKKGRNHLCPYFDTCPGTKMLRECYSSSVVITTVAGFAVSRVGKNKELFLEMVLDQADIVVFDESDRVQKTLDHLFMPETSFDSYISECAEDCSSYMRLTSQKREENRAAQYYDELQRQSVTVMSCILKALRQELGEWNRITYGDSFSALTLLDNLYRDEKYRIPQKIYNSLYALINQESGQDQENPLWKLLRASCQSTDFRLFDQLYAEWLEQEKDVFNREKDTKTTRIQDARIKLIICLIYFDYFIRDLSDAYEACHETSYGQNELFGFLQSRFQEQQRILPSALCGNLFGMKKTDSQDIVLFRQFAFGRSLMKDLPYLKTDEEGNAAGPHVVLLSGSSWAEGSYEYHINRPVNYILEADKDKRVFLEKTAFFESGLVERVSGSGDKRIEMLTALTRKSVDSIIEEYDRKAGKILLIVNSYAQAEKVQETLQTELRKKQCDALVCRMVSDTINVENSEGTIRRGEVSKFATWPDSILIAPAMAIERGHNIVDETGHSALGAVFFMVRPMSVPDDVQEKGSKLNGYIESHCKREQGESVFDYNARIRKLATKRWQITNGSRVYGLSEMDQESQRDIVATLFILILQIFGRLARVTDTTKSAPHVHFVDGAFRKPGDKPNDFDCLDSLGRYLDALMQRPESAEIAKTLYEPFYKAFKGGITNGQ